MSQSRASGRHAPRPLSDRAVQPFQSAEDAWMWFAHCQAARRDGARFVADAGAVARPCDPDDLPRVLKALRRSGVIGGGHVRVLVDYGLALSAPDPRVAAQERAARLWDEALDRMTTILRRKGIVA